MVCGNGTTYDDGTLTYYWAISDRYGGHTGFEYTAICNRHGHHKHGNSRGLVNTDNNFCINRKEGNIRQVVVQKTNMQSVI